MLRSIQAEPVLRAVAQLRPSKKMPRLPAVILIVPVMLLALVKPASAHPQCLDFKPPFKPPWHLEFCNQYEQFGCCDQGTDNMIAERYWDIIEQLEAAGHELCTDMLKEIMCQVNIFSWVLITINAMIIIFTLGALQSFHVCCSFGCMFSISDKQTNKKILEKMKHTQLELLIHCSLF